MSKLFIKLINLINFCLQGNSGLKPKEGEITSRPWQWPIDFRVSVYTWTMYYININTSPVFLQSKMYWCTQIKCVCSILNSAKLRFDKIFSGADILWEQPQDLPVGESHHILGLSGGSRFVCCILFGPCSQSQERAQGKQSLDR